MSAFDAIVAQEPALASLKRAVATDRLASAYLFEGPSGVGKQMTALALAEEVIGQGARIRAGNHPDVRVFGPRDEGKRNIQVEFLRAEILPVAQFAPFEAKAAFLVFPEADISFPEVHPEAANALLKTLEEPRPGVCFVLLAERPDRLLPTIRSRCQRLRFGRLPAAVVSRILEERGVSEADRGAAVALAGGRADLALTLASEGTASALLELALEVDDAAASAHPGVLVDAAERLSRADDLRLALETLMTFYRDVAASGLGLEDDALAFRHVADEVRRRASAVSPGGAAARVERIGAVLDALDRNANPQITLDALLFGLRALA